MIIAVSGWRGWTHGAFVRKELSNLITYVDDYVFTVRVGDAAGVDAICRQYLADEMPTIEVVVYRADWANEGPAAGAIRNRRMLLGLDDPTPNANQKADLLLAFPQPGRTRPARNSGTWNAIHQAHWRGIEIRIPAYEAAAPSKEDLTPEALFELGGAA